MEQSQEVEDEDYERTWERVAAVDVAKATRSQTFLGERYRRLARRRGKRKALVATARATLVIIFHLLSDPAARFRDLGPGYYDDKISAERKIPQPRPPVRSPRPHRHHHPRRGHHPRSPNTAKQQPTAQTAAGCCRLPG